MPSELCSINGVCELGAVGYNQAGLVLEGQLAGDRSGYSVSGVGDVNGDGVDDLMVGAYTADPGGRGSAGKSYVVFGSVGGAAWSSGTLALAYVGGAVPGLVLEGQAALDYSGISVSGVGDVNGDGVDDLMVGAYTAAPGGRSYAGKSYVVFGSLGGTAWSSGTLALADVGGTVPGLVFEGELAGDRSGISISGVGDVNGDGVDDLMVGAYTAAPGGRSAAGKSYVVFGSVNGTAWSSGTLALADVGGSVPGLVFEGQRSGDESGRSVSGAGDVNGDGVDDLMVGAWGANPGGRLSAGKSYVVFGSVGGTAWGSGTLALADVGGSVPGLVLEGELADDFSGVSVSGVGDVNGDGVDDLMLGAREADPGGRSAAGKSYVVFGSAGGAAWGSGTLALADVGSAVPGLVFEGELAGDESGNSVSGVGDVNGDGVDDFMVGAYRAGLGGKSYMVFGSLGGAAWSSGTLALADVGGVLPGVVLEGGLGGGLTGGSVSGVGDINGDGVDDLMVGAWAADPGGRGDAGKSYVVFGVGQPTSAPTVSLTLLPTVAPTALPTSLPTLTPTLAPTLSPTDLSMMPTPSPTLPSTNGVDGGLIAGLVSLLALLLGLSYAGYRYYNHRKNTPKNSLKTQSIPLKQLSIQTKPATQVLSTLPTTPSLPLCIPSPLVDKPATPPFTNPVASLAKKGKQEKILQETNLNVDKAKSSTKTANEPIACWHFDPALKSANAIQQGASYQLIPVSANQVDIQKVVRYYQHHPVEGYGIDKVEVIYNPKLNRSFALRMDMLNDRQDEAAFTARWHSEDADNAQKRTWRNKVHQRFLSQSQPYQDATAPDVRLLPLWHGTTRTALDGIFKTGFANLATTDSGFFGNGIYGAHEASYAHQVYAKEGVLLLNWVAIGSAYPVIKGDMAKLQGKSNYQNYDAHYIPVVPRDPHNPMEDVYYPTKPDQKSTFTEVVVFNDQQCLPRYLVTLKKLLKGVRLSPLPNIPQAKPMSITSHDLVLGGAFQGGANSDSENSVEKDMDVLDGTWMFAQ